MDEMKHIYSSYINQNFKLEPQKKLYNLNNTNNKLNNK